MEPESTVQVRLSVRQLVEFLRNTGSIDNRFTGFDRALEGVRIHRRLQKAAGDGYEAEVSIKADLSAAGVAYRLEGRADGIFTGSDGLVMVDEIKTVTCPTEQITEEMEPVHWAQAQVYAAIWAAQKGLEEVGVRLTYFQVEDQQIVRFERRFSAQTLTAFLQEMLEEYAPWAKRQAQWQADRTQDLAALAFPFSQFRPGQHALAGEVYRACRQGRRLMVQAPTGIGKTISTLYPALRAMGEGDGERVFYLTARTTTRRAAWQALDLLPPSLHLRSIALTAKDKACLLEHRECTPEACPYANGYYDRVKAALWEGLDETRLDGPALEALARRHTVCPFELGLDLALWCDVIVGDYNYLFDPVVRLSRFFETPGDHLFLVDEAHNLPDRAREMYSAELGRAQLAEARKALGKGRSRLKTALGKVNTQFLTWRDQCREAPERTLFFAPAQEAFSEAVRRCLKPLEEWLGEHRQGPAHDVLLQLYFDFRAWLRVADGYDEHYITQISLSGGQVLARQLCLDPSDFLNASFALGRAAVLFSATLAPPSYYRDILGCPEARCVALPSPFPRENLGLFCACRVSTTYRSRAASLDEVCRFLAAMTEGRAGNYLAFFPSYAYLNQAAQRFAERFPQIPTLLQQPGMQDSERETFLARFSAASGETLLGFAVMGGVFGEGVDLVGDRLIGAAVVGVGLPQVNPVREMLRRYFESSRGSGFAYAYQYPGMNKVLQAAGRVIRTPNDQGVVLLIDERFTWEDYRALLPAHWNGCRPVLSASQLADELRAFWAEKPCGTPPARPAEKQ